jgi:hypothetical protein
MELLSIFGLPNDYLAGAMSIGSESQQTRSHRYKEKWMKYICLGYLEPGKFEGMTEDERHRTFDECFEYNDHLRSNGHLPPKYLFSLRTALTPVLEKRQSRDDRRPLRGNQGTAWRHSNP